MSDVGKKVSGLMVEGLMHFTDDGRLQLFGQRCEVCGVIHFPATLSCPACSTDKVVQEMLGPDAVLHSITTDRVGTFLGYPHLIGQVQFDHGPFVQGFVAHDVEDPPEIGAPVELVPFRLNLGEEGIGDVFLPKQGRMTMRDVSVMGVGMTRFGQFSKSFIEHGTESVLAALSDAGVTWPDIQRVFCGAMAIAPFAGNQIGEALGLTGVPIVNLDNASASGNSAFHLAYRSVATEECDLAIALGVGVRSSQPPDMSPGSPSRAYLAAARANPMTGWALAARRRQFEYGTSAEIFGRIAVKSRRYGALNPFSQTQQAMSLDEVMSAPVIADPLTVPMCFPWGDGGAAVVVASTEVAQRMGRQAPIKILGSRMFGEEFQQEEAWGLGLLLRRAAQSAYEGFGLGPEDMDVVQLHDGTASEELAYYEALGLCAEGEGDKLVMDGATGPGGSTPVNTDGGLISRGHPLGPTGCAQIHEIVLQLRGQARERQVPDARTALIQSTGAGEVFFMHMLQRA